jgi:predicted permease
MTTLLARLRSFVRSVLGRTRLESEMEAEVCFHLKSRTEDLIREGLSPHQAARRAKLEFGGIASHKDSMRASVGLRWIDDLWADLLYGARILRKSPGFTAIAVASLALAIGTNTTIFSYGNEILFARLGVPHAEQLRMFRLTGDGHMAVREMWSNDAYREDGKFHIGVFPNPSYQLMRRQNDSVEDIFAFKELSNIAIAATGTPELGKVELVSGNFYTQMQVKPQLGRPLEPADDGVPGTVAVAMISDGFWHRDFGGAPDVLGKTVSVSTIPVTIVGVNPPGFTGPDGVETTSPQIFLPLSMLPAIVPIPGKDGPLIDPNQFWLELMARVKPGVSNAQAEAALNVSFNAAFRGTGTVEKGETVPRLSLEDGSRGVTWGLRTLLKPLYVLLGLGGLVLLLACANIANLMLARASSRQREMSARMALGAGHGRILRQVLTESLLLSAMGGAAGLVLGYTSRNLIPLLLRTGWDGGEMPVQFDWRVFGFTSAVTLLTGIFFGIVPAWRLTHSEISTALKEGARTATRKRKAWSGKMIVAFQVALSTVLVMAAVFFLRTLVNLNPVDPGFPAKNLLLFDINVPRARYPVEKTSGLHRRLEEAFAAVPGVESETMINIPLVTSFQWNSMFEIEGAPQKKNLDPTKKTGDGSEQAMVSTVGPHFFPALSIPVLAGRGFTAQDTETSVPVAIVNRTLMRKFFPNANPIGKRFRRSSVGPEATTRWIEIVGVCADTRYFNMREPTPPVYFALDRQYPIVGSVTFVVRSSLRPDALISSLRRAAQQIDPDLPLSNIRTQQQQIDASMQQERMFASLTAGFGLLALALACVGIYGIMAYTVSMRTNEIGIRLALGAAREQIQAIVLRETGWLAFSGVVIGLLVTLASIRVVKSMLYGLTPKDPITLGGSVVLLLLMAFVAGWVPAYRGSRVDPAEALRHD